MPRKLEVAAPSAQEYGRTFLVDPAEVEIVRGFNTRVSKTDIATLAADIEMNGQIQPLSVRRNVDGVLELVTGQRRLEAIRLLNSKLTNGEAPLKVRVEVVDATDLEALLSNISENNEREGLTAVDYANQVARLLEAGMTRGKIAQTFKRSKAWVSEMEGVGRLPDAVKEKIDKGLINSSTAVELTRIKKPEDQIAAAEEASKLRGKGKATKVAKVVRKQRAVDEGGRVKRSRTDIVTFFDDLKLDGTVEKPGMLCGIGEVLSKYGEGYYTDASAKTKIRQAVTALME